MRQNNDKIPGFPLSWWPADGSMTPCVILLHRSGVPMVPISGIQGVKKKADNSFSQREEDDPPYYNFSDEKFMVQANMASCVFGCQKLFPAPQNNLPARLKAREGLHSEVVAPESGKTGTET